MFEVLLFSISISIDAFGYSLGFGSKNVKPSKFDFLILNLINTSILIFFFLIYSYIFNFINEYNFLNKITALLLLLFGIYYIYDAFKKVVKSLKITNLVGTQNFNLLNKQIKYFSLSDLFVLLIVFIVENAFSTLIFFNQFNNAFLFIFSNFIFHYLFFTIGFDLGSKIAKRIATNTPVITGTIFILLGLFEFFG